MINQDNMLYALIKAKALTVENGVTISKMHNVQYLINQVLELSGCGAFDRSEHDDFEEVVNKYKESKGDKMITEKEQKIVGAVNTLKEVWMWPSSDNVKVAFDSDDVIWLKEFNQCVKEMVETSDAESRLGYLVYRSLLTKENSDYSYYEKESKMSEDKPKVKVEYVKVSETPREIYQMLLSGDELYVNKTGKIYFDGEQFMHDDSRITYIKSDNDIYRKVETEITWQDELYAFLDSKGIKHYTSKSDVCKSKDEFEVNSVMTFSELIEMCHLVSSMNK